MLSSTRIHVTQHAHERFRERGGCGQISQLMRYARPATKKERKWISQCCTLNSERSFANGGILYYVCKESGFVFVIQCTIPGIFRVVTCWPLPAIKNKAAKAEAQP